MADHAHDAADVPQMDYAEHERTYRGFMLFTEVLAVGVLALVAGLAVGGVKHAWGFVIFGTIVTLVTIGIGIAAPRISWRAPAVPLVVFLLALLLM